MLEKAGPSPPLPTGRQPVLSIRPGGLGQHLRSLSVHLQEWVFTCGFFGSLEIQSLPPDVKPRNKVIRAPKIGLM